MPCSRCEPGSIRLCIVTLEALPRLRHASSVLVVRCAHTHAATSAHAPSTAVTEPSDGRRLAPQVVVVCYQRLALAAAFEAAGRFHRRGGSADAIATSQRLPRDEAGQVEFLAGSFVDRLPPAASTKLTLRFCRQGWAWRPATSDKRRRRAHGPAPGRARRQCTALRGGLQAQWVSWESPLQLAWARQN